MGVIVWLKGSLRELLEKIKSTLSLVFVSHPVVRLNRYFPGESSTAQEPGLLLNTSERALFWRGVSYVSQLLDYYKIIV